MSRVPVVAIVGGGFSGAATAFHLLGLARGALEVVVVEPAAGLGRGLAYSTNCDSHCLNVPAGRLGLDPAHEAGFVDWLRSRGHGHAASSFVPRRLLGDYVGEALQNRATERATERAPDRAASGAISRHVRARAEAMVFDGMRVLLTLSTGEILAADRVVLATGHLPPTRPGSRETVDWTMPGMVPDPWCGQALAALPTNGDVLVVGSGLTAIDVVLQLDDAGHRGRVHLLSRRGLLPQPHRANEIRPAALAPVDLADAPDLRALVARVRAWIEEHVADGGDWRDAMAGLRASTPQLWQRLDTADRRRFLRHLQPFWDSHRHRLAPAIDDRVRALRAAGRLTLQAGRLAAVVRQGGELHATWHARGDGRPTVRTVARIVNCTGPSADLARARDPLLASLRDAGTLGIDPLGQGARVDAALQTCDASGRPVDGVYCIGPLLKAQRWEAVAIPELRVHARDVAGHIVATLGLA